MAAPEKVLIIRLSSFGDILQCLCTPQALKNQFSNSEIHWVTRSDFAELLKPHPIIDHVWSFDKDLGLVGWISLCKKLSKENYTHIYDAHNNLRSRILMLVLTFCFARPKHFLRRSKHRLKRMLLFRFRKNLFEKPFRGQHSFLEPLTKWGIPKKTFDSQQLFFQREAMRAVENAADWSKPWVALAPSAAWEMKRWPIDYWQKLIKESGHNFILLGGPDDHFCQDLADLAPERTINLAGQLKLLESCAILTKVQMLVSADTGLLHAADLIGLPTVALIGPTAFGFPSHKNSTVLMSDLPCQPCSKDGRGRCVQDVYQKCMRLIEPNAVQALLPQKSKGTPSPGVKTQ